MTRLIRSAQSRRATLTMRASIAKETNVHVGLPSAFIMS